MQQQKRNPNFSEEEKKILVREVLKYEEKLFGKFSNSISKTTKDGLWEKIAITVSQQSNYNRYVHYFSLITYVIMGLAQLLQLYKYFI